VRRRVVLSAGKLDDSLVEDKGGLVFISSRGPSGALVNIWNVPRKLKDEIRRKLVGRRVRVILECR
jgi:hypothetical protein